MTDKTHDSEYDGRDNSDLGESGSERIPSTGKSGERNPVPDRPPIAGSWSTSGKSFFRPWSCSDEFRTRVQSRLPIVIDKQEYARFLSYLMSGGWTCHRTSRIIIPANLIRACEGKSSSGYSAESFLNRFKAEVLPEFEWEDYKAGKYCRRVTSRGFPDWLKDGLEDELLDGETMSFDGHDLVLFDSGEKGSSQAAYQESCAVQKSVHLRFKRGEISEHQRIALDYLNGLDVRRLTSVIRPNWDEALAAVQGMKDPNRRIQQAQVLRQIQLQPRPLYAPAKNSDRLYTTAPSLQTVKREVRKILTRGCYEFDLQSAQLSIAAAIWHVPELYELVESGQVWPELVMWMKPEASESASDREIKGAIKGAVYALTFQAGRRRIANTLAESGIFSLTAVDRLLDHPAMGALYESRSRVMEEIKTEYGATNAFGERVRMRKGRSLPSIPAEVAQSYEQALIYPAFELAKNDRRFKIILLQHDGFTVRFRDNRDSGVAKPMRDIIEVVNAKADELGIPTKLEVEELT